MEDVMRILIFIVAIFCFATAHSQEVHPPTLAITSPEDLSLALTFIVKGDEYYQKKRYKSAIEQYTQSVKYLLGTDKAIQKKLGRTYTKIAQSYKRIKDREQTAVYYKKALDVYTALNDKKYMARTFNTLAEAERYLGNLVVALNYSKQSIEIHQNIEDPEGFAKTLMGAGIIYRHIGRYEKSLEHIHKAYEYYKKVNNLSGLAKTSNEMGHIYIRLEEFKQAKYFFQETINIPENKVDQNTLATAYREMAIISQNEGDYEYALAMGFKAYEIYQRENQPFKESLTARIIADVYRAQQDNSKATAYYKKSLSLAIENGYTEYQIKAQIPLAEILIAKNTSEAVDLLINSLALAKQTKDVVQMLYAYRVLREAENFRGNFAKALSYAKKEIALIKKINKQNEDEQLVLTKATLHSHKMEIELDSLKEKLRLDQLELMQKNNEIEIAEQTRVIHELELMKNKYASITLALLLVICIVLVIFIYRRFVVSKARNKELDYLASRDPLTNCYNRRILFERMNQDFSDIERFDEYSIIMADIDNFKYINDTYGHNAGDAVICGVANILQGCIRQSDIVTRFGGEEFCIILHQVSKEKAMYFAETMRHKVENSSFEDIPVTCSFGVTSIQFNAKTPSALIDQADLALYQSKKSGRNQVTLWDKNLTKTV